jgi:YD repeat-containing protein
MQAAVRLLLLLAVLPISLFATSSVDIRIGPAYDGLVHPSVDCILKDKTVKAIRIETAIFNDDGQEIRRATLRTCSKTDSAEEFWIYSLDEDGSVRKREKDTTRFDDHDRVIEQIFHTWTEKSEVEMKGEQVLRHQITYDAAGKPLDFRMIDSDGSAHTSRSTFDDRGDEVAVTGIDSDGEIEFVTQYQFDDQHHRISESTDRGPVDHRYKYDPQGRLIEEITGEGESRNTVLYTYDEGGRQLSKSTFVGLSPRMQWRHGFSYWPNGYIKEEWSLDSQGTAARFESYAYDEHDHMTQNWVYNPGKNGEVLKFLVTVDGHLQSFGGSNGLPIITYAYDSHSSWVEAVETKLSDYNEPASEREVTAIFYRQIEYR